MQGFFASSTVQQEKPVGLVPRCGACGLLKGCQSPKMKPYGKGRQGVLVVGEAPGKTEDEEGRPFIGKAGEFLRDTLDDLGIDLDRDALTTNALICRPPGNKIQDPRQIDYCRPNLINTINEFKPRVIVTLGGSALHSVLAPYWKDDIGPLERWTGWTIPLEQHWVCPTYHPSYLLRMKNPLLDKLFKKHLERAFNIEDDTPARPDLSKEVEIIYDDREAAEAILEMGRAGGFVAVDYETNCLKPEWPRAQIYSCALSNKHQTISYPWVGSAIGATGGFLQSDRTRKIASNIKMEERWTLKNFGWGVTNWNWDTMLAAHCLDNREGITSIKFQAFVKLGIPTYNANIEPYLFSSKNSPYNRIQEIEMKDLLLYGGVDAFAEREVAILQMKEMGL